MFFFVAYSFIYLFFFLIKKNYNSKKIDLKVSVV